VGAQVTSHDRRRLRTEARGVSRGSLLCTTRISPIPSPKGVTIGCEKGVTFGCELTKIDNYDPTLSGGSEDPSDPAQTVRVLTLMLADEY
jgi:hypothetical protein